jgi:CheY-like chemotaxis protein
MSPEKLERLFIPFERLGAEGTRIEGTGIGLALSQRIVTALGGEIGANSTVGEGTTFWVELPASELPAPAPTENVQFSEDQGTPGSSRRRTILYVENQDLDLRLMERLLTRRPEYTLLSAMQGGLALDLAREHRPDLILLDLDLPDLPGEEVLRRLKADAELRNIPVVTVGADTTAERVQELLALGAIGCLKKPYHVAEFFRTLERVMARVPSISMSAGGAPTLRSGK